MYIGSAPLSLSLIQTLASSLFHSVPLHCIPLECTMSLKGGGGGPAGMYHVFMRGVISV